MTLERHTVLRAVTSAVTYVPDDGSDPIVFSSATGCVHRLRGSSATIRAAIDGARPVDAVIEMVSSIHRVASPTVAADIVDTIQHFVDLGLVVIVDRV